MTNAEAALFWTCTALFALAVCWLLAPARKPSAGDRYRAMRQARQQRERANGEQTYPPDW